MEEAKILCEPYSLEEVKRATFELHPHKAPGPDGMKAKFYQKCWDFLGHDVWLVVEEFRKKGKFVREINNIVIALIPKKEDFTSMHDLRPISLCNTISK